jgi:hypothetical protein
MPNVFEIKKPVELHYLKKIGIALTMLGFLGLAFLWAEIQHG